MVVGVPSRAVAVSQEIEYVLVVSTGPRLTSLSLNWTLATLTSSAAVAETMIAPETALSAAGAVRDTVGGVVSGAGAVVKITADGCTPFPVASFDLTSAW